MACPTSIHPERTFGAALFEFRTGRGLLQRELADRAQISATYVSEIENDRRVPPGRSKLTAIEAALSLPLDQANELRTLAAIDRALDFVVKEVAHQGRTLSSRHIAALRTQLQEAAMKR